MRYSSARVLFTLTSHASGPSVSWLFRNLTLWGETLCVSGCVCLHSKLIFPKRPHKSCSEVLSISGIWYETHDQNLEVRKLGRCSVCQYNCCHGNCCWFTLDLYYLYSLVSILYKTCTLLVVVISAAWPVLFTDYGRHMCRVGLTIRLVGACAQSGPHNKTLRT